MPEDDSLNLKMNKDILNQVLERIKWDFTYCKAKCVRRDDKSVTFLGTCDDAKR